MKVFLLVCGLLSSAVAQYVDPLVGLLAPASIPQNLYSIRGPIYVEPSSLQPPIYAPAPLAVGPPMVGPPIVGPPVVGPPVMGPPVLGSGQFQSGLLGSPLMGSPSPYNPYASNYPIQMMYDEQQDEVSPPSRRFNTNVQSGIQQIGQGNMNLQGNIQQVNRRSLQPQLQQASRSFESQTNPNQRTGLAQADEILLSDAALRNVGQARALSSQPQSDQLQGLSRQQQAALQAYAGRGLQNDQVQSLLRNQQLQATKREAVNPYTRSQLQALGLGQMQNDQLQAYYGLGQTQNDQLQAYGLGQMQNDQLQAYGLGQMQNDQLQAYGRGQTQNDQLQAYGLGQMQNDQLQAYGLGQMQNDQLQAYGLGQMQNDQLQAYGRGQMQNDQLQAYGLGQMQNDQLQAYGRGQMQNDQLQAYGLGQMQNDQLQAYGLGQMQNDQLQAYGLGQMQNDQLQAYGLGQMQNDQVQAYKRRQQQAQAQALRRNKQNEQLQALRRNQQNEALARAQQGVASRSQAQVFRPRPPVVVSPSPAYASQLQTFARQDHARRHQNPLNDEQHDDLQMNDEIISKHPSLSDSLRQAKGYMADMSSKFNDAALFNDDLNDTPSQRLQQSDSISAKRAQLLEDALNDEMKDEASSQLNDKPK